VQLPARVLQGVFCISALSTKRHPSDRRARKRFAHSRLEVGRTANSREQGSTLTIYASGRTVRLAT
jgi:hypothetical protein